MHEGDENAHVETIREPIGRCQSQKLDLNIEINVDENGLILELFALIGEADDVGIVRGYRTAKLSFPGGGDESLNVPIAGETTVIPTSRILCVLQTAKLADRLAAPPQAAEHPGRYCSGF